MSSAPGEPFDPGLQPERTLLAWQRTCLALGVGSALVIRLTTEAVGAIGIVLGIAGVTTTAAAYLGIRLRYRRVHEHLSTARDLPTEGTALALLAIALLLLGAGAAAYIVGVGLSRLT